MRPIHGAVLIEFEAAGGVSVIVGIQVNFFLTQATPVDWETADLGIPDLGNIKIPVEHPAVLHRSAVEIDVAEVAAAVHDVDPGISGDDIKVAVGIPVQRGRIAHIGHIFDGGAVRRDAHHLALPFFAHIQVAARAEAHRTSDRHIGKHRAHAVRGYFDDLLAHRCAEIHIAVIVHIDPVGPLGGRIHNRQGGFEGKGQLIAPDFRALHRHLHHHGHIGQVGGLHGQFGGGCRRHRAHLIPETHQVVAGGGVKPAALDHHHILQEAFGR